MKAIATTEFGGPEVLVLQEHPLPELREHDLIVRVHTAGVNRADLTFRKGVYGRVNFGDSETIGLEIAGTVTQIGSMVSGFRIGERAMGIVGGGGYAEFARIDADMAIHIPDALSFVEAAAIPEAFVTAHEAMCHLGRLAKEETVLIHAAASGVGTAAIQMAKLLGARIIGTASSGKIDRLKQLGVDVAIAYDRQDFEEVVNAATEGNGADVILDFIGAPNFERNLRSLADGGRLVQVGLMAGLQPATLPLPELVHRNLQVIGTIMKSRSTAQKVAMSDRFKDRWLTAFESGKLKPIIDSTFPLRDASAAHRRVESHQGVGKIVLICE